VFGRRRKLARGRRVDVVNPPWVDETLAAMGMDVSDSLPAATVAKAHCASLEGTQNGATIDARDVA
jgi:hypothetical protein